jgi:hypothetical protein
MTATTTRQALIGCFATLLIADQSNTHDISGNLPMPPPHGRVLQGMLRFSTAGQTEIIPYWTSVRISPRYVPRRIFEVLCKKGHYQGMPEGV